MSEVEKMYENAGINKKCIDKRYEKCTGVCYDCKHFIYPPFTAEKQLELIKWLLASSTDRNIDLYKQNDFYRFTVIHIGMDKVFEGIDKDFAVALAGLINQLWQDLTESEQKQIRSILND